MTDSFVVSSGGSVSGGGNKITLDNAAQKSVAFFFPFVPHVQSALDYSKANSKHSGGLVVVAVATFIIYLIMILYLYRGVMSSMDSDTMDGIGARGAGTGDLKFSYPLNNQGMTNRTKYDTMENRTKYDTFLSGNEPPSFNDVPNYILRKENRMQDALATYANLRSSGQDVPDWAEYWNNWQSDNNYSYSGRGMYDTTGSVKSRRGGSLTSSGARQISGKGHVKGKYYAQEQKELAQARMSEGMSSARLGLGQQVY